jgi:hypothetical protein
MLLTPPALTLWTIINVVAAAAFMHFASWTWLEPNLRGEDVARGGDAVVFMLSAFPILAIAGICNLVWISLVEVAHRKTAVSRPWPAIIVIATLWISALTVNRLRSAGF